MTPPQKAVSTKHFAVASRSFSWKWASVVVGGMLFLVEAEIKRNSLKFQPLQAVTSLWTHSQDLNAMLKTA